MTMAEPVSGVVVRATIPTALDRIRRGDDRAAASGAPPHITLLFPFLPVTQLRPTVRQALAEVAAGVDPFEVRFARVGRFPGAIYLVPEPSAPFAALTAAIVARFPDYQPYEGAFDEVVPHLTLVESPTAPLDRIADAAARYLPFDRPVTAIEVLVEETDGRWRSLWRIRLGVRP